VSCGNNNNNGSYDQGNNDNGNGPAVQGGQVQLRAWAGGAARSRQPRVHRVQVRARRRRVDNNGQTNDPKNHSDSHIALPRSDLPLQH
jgi:hypothetical protein